MASELPHSIRHRFPILQQVAYANSCSQGALSDSVRGAYETYLSDWDEKGAPWELWVELNERARSTIAKLLNARPDEVAVTTSTSAGVSSLLSGLRFDGGRSKIVISDFEFPTIGQIAHAQELLGRKVVHVPAGTGGTVPLEHFADVIDEETALVCVTYVSFRNGAKTDIEAVIRLAHERGALVLVDAFQAVGAIPIDVKALGVDFLSGGMLKYLLGSAGLAFLYCRSGLLPGIMPVHTGWFADEDIFAMDIHDYSPAPSARKFESGTPPVPSIYAGVAGVELMHSIGVAETEQHVRRLTARLTDRLDEIGATIATPRDPAHRGPMTAVACTDAEAMTAALARDRVLTTPRDGNIRLSLHCYNSEEDVDAIVAGIARHTELLA